jgi:hypothetical protein
MYCPLALIGTAYKKEREGISVTEVNHKIFGRVRKVGKSNY